MPIILKKPLAEADLLDIWDFMFLQMLRLIHREIAFLHNRILHMNIRLPWVKPENYIKYSFGNV